ncbi:hypothetical protein TcYC6_0038740 [Trypanosoma cruzi]|nr:hypothetical protein TcYC6_0038740 [Trypanosoma cruzi]
MDVLLVPSLDCGEVAHVPGIDAVLREGSCHDSDGVRRHVAWDSAVPWENTEPTVRPQSTSESGTVELSSVTSSCTASRPRRSDSIAERESVATGTRVGDWDAAARRGTENCLWPC